MPNFWEEPIRFLAEWLQGVLTGWGMSPDLASFLVTAIGAFALPTLALLASIFLIWYERKMYSRFQDRLGPNRIGPFGLFQTFADMGKIFTKEMITPIGIDKVPYNLAPVVSVAAVLLMWAIIPFAPTIVGVPLAVGLLYVVAVGGFGELAIMLAGWSSNNKYALMGGFRAMAMLVSYEVPMVMALLIPALLAGSMNLMDIVNAQDVAFIFMAPVAALIFFITIIAESGRAPFDFIEAESEIVAGINVEYSGLKFGFFYVAEFLHAFTASMLFSTLFLGGFRGPFVDQVPLLGIVYLLIKTFAVYYFSILFHGALPRFRTDQMLDFNWKVLAPSALAMIFVTTLVDKTVTLALAGASDTVVLIVRTVALLAANALAFWFITSQMSRRIRPSRRPVVSEPRPVARADGSTTEPDGISV